KLKFVFFKIQPSRSDSDGILKNLQNVMLKAKGDTASFKYFADIYSEVPYSKDTMSISELPNELLTNFDESKIGTMIGPFSGNNTYGIYQISGTVSANELLVKASHILIKSTGNEAKDAAEATRVYNEVISGMDFGAAAAKYSSDLGNAKSGGELGWFGKGRMVKEFEEACFNGPMGVVQKPVKTDYGYHIIKVTGKTSQKYIVEKIINSIKPSASTRDDIYNQANDFAYIAEKNGFEKEAEVGNLKIEETPAFNEESQYLPTIGVNKALLKFSFENGLNTLSPVFKGANGYVVAKISEVINEGVRKFEDVQKQAQSLLLAEKKYVKAKSTIEEIKKKNGANFAAASSVFSKARFDTAGPFTTSGSIPKLGIEYNFAAKAYELSVGAVSAPIKGSRGYLLAKLLSKDAFDQNAFTTQKSSLRERTLQEKKNSFVSQWLAKMKKDADIVDKRHVFYNR
ncbi:MAG: peptidylprolyl isomerase, partial [Ignavibacteria bacterium]|nr:peptidylprolyl isomerase [Ignavibacteria bacterium]